MKHAITILLLANGGFPVWYMARKCLSRQGIEFNHVLAFSCGFLFYWVLPVGLGMWRFFDDTPAMAFWYGIFDDIDDAKFVGYLLISLGAYLSFVLGTERWERRPRKRPVPSDRRFLDTGIMKAYLLLAAMFLLFAGFEIRGEFFHGYSNIGAIEELNSRSVFSAVVMFSISLWIMNASMRHQNLGRSASIRSVFANGFLTLYAIEAVLWVSVGSRYVVLTSAFIFATYCSVYFKKWSPARMWGFLVLLLASALMVGAFRADLRVTQSVGEIAFDGFAETLYGAFSLTYFLREYSFGVLRWPVYLLSDCIYLVPRILLPMKDSMIISPEDRGFHIESPVGGLNSFFSFMVNFGALGTMVFFFLLSYGMAALKSRRQSVLCRAIYSMISGSLLISFFRNSFEVSLIKDILQMSILIPAFVLSSVRFYSHSGPFNHEDRPSAGIPPS